MSIPWRRGQDWTLSSLIGPLILVLIAMTPVFSIGEIVDLFLARVASRSVNATPGYIKALKDVGFVVIIAISALTILMRGKYNKFLLFGLFAVLVATGLSAALTLATNGHPRVMVLVAVGVRWAIPLLMIFFLTDYVDEGLLRSISKVLMITFYVHLVLQVFQLLFMGGYYGVAVFGLAARVPGFFLIPNTAAFFAVMVLFFKLYFDPDGRKRRYILLTGFSVLITQSGAGFVVFLLLVILYFVPTKLLRISLILAPIAGAAFLLIFSSFQSRENYLEGSGVARIDIFMNVLRETGVFSSNFGIGTNAARLLKAGQIMDSQVASVVFNLGHLFTVFFGVLGFLWLILLMVRNEKLLISYTAIFFLFGLTTIFFEAFPMNLLFSVLTAYFVQRDRFGVLYRRRPVQYSEKLNFKS